MKSQREYRPGGWRPFSRLPGRLARHWILKNLRWRWGDSFYADRNRPSRRLKRKL